MEGGMKSTESNCVNEIMRVLRENSVEAEVRPRRRFRKSSFPCVPPFMEFLRHQCTSSQYCFYPTLTEWIVSGGPGFTVSLEWSPLTVLEA